jgi:thiosulfate reductase cytochrome b subunit
MTLTGTGILIGTNWLCWLALALLGQSLWSRRRGRSKSRPEAAST